MVRPDFLDMLIALLTRSAVSRVGLHDLRLETEVCRAWERHAPRTARTRPFASRPTAAGLPEPLLLSVPS